MTHMTILRTYADRVDPTTLPPTVKLCHTDFSLTIFDKYPKALFHFVLVPFIRPPLRAADLRDLTVVLQLPREQAKTILENMRRDALAARALVEEEMRAQYGFAWGVQVGFHAVPSLEYVPVPLKHLQHVHLHIISTEFRGEYLKNKKHVNSFHPTLGFFLHLDDVLSWFEPDIDPTWFAMKSHIDKKEYEKRLKDDMTCPHCDETFKTIPKLTDHLRRAWDETREKHKKEATPDVVEPEVESTGAQADAAGAGTKRKLNDTEGGGSDADCVDSDSHASKRPHTDISVDTPQEA